MERLMVPAPAWEPKPAAVLCAHAPAEHGRDQLAALRGG